MKVDKIFKPIWPSKYCVDFKGPDNKGCVNPRQKSNPLQDEVAQVQMACVHCRVY